MDIQYNQLLKYVYFEGYADSYEEAEYLLEELSNDEFEELLDLYEATFHGKMPGRAIQTRPTPSGNYTPGVNEPDQRDSAMQSTFNRMRDTARAETDAENAAREAAKAARVKEPTTVPSRGIGQNEPLLRRRTPEGHRKRGSTPRVTAQIRARILSTGRDPRDSRNRVSPNVPPEKLTTERKEKAKRIRAALKNSSKWGTPEAAKEEFVIDYLVTEGYTDNYDSAAIIYESMSDEWLDTILRGE